MSKKTVIIIMINCILICLNLNANEKETTKKVVIKEKSNESDSLSFSKAINNDPHLGLIKKMSYNSSGKVISGLIVAGTLMLVLFGPSAVSTGIVLGLYGWDKFLINSGADAITYLYIYYAGLFIMGGGGLLLVAGLIMLLVGIFADTGKLSLFMENRKEGRLASFPQAYQNNVNTSIGLKFSI